MSMNISKRREYICAFLNTSTRTLANLLRSSVHMSLTCGLTCLHLLQKDSNRRPLNIFNQRGLNLRHQWTVRLHSGNIIFGEGHATVPSISPELVSVPNLQLGSPLFKEHSSEWSRPEQGSM